MRFEELSSTTIFAVQLVRQSQIIRLSSVATRSSVADFGSQDIALTSSETILCVKKTLGSKIMVGFAASASCPTTRFPCPSEFSGLKRYPSTMAEDP